MNQELTTIVNRERVIKHLQGADWLFIVLPIIFAAILLIGVPIAWSIIERTSGNPTEIGGFNFDGLVIIAGIFLCSIFCVGYAISAFILALLARRNRTFRILLISVLLFATAVFGGAIYYLQIPSEAVRNQLFNGNNYYFEKSALRFERNRHK